MKVKAKSWIPKVGGKCQRYEKVKYKTEDDARRGLMWIWSHTNTPIGDLHIYKCEYCNYYHVGHWSKFKGEQNGI